MSWPALHKSLMTAISSHLISLEQTLCLTVAMITSMFWDNTHIYKSYLEIWTSVSFSISSNVVFSGELFA